MNIWSTPKPVFDKLNREFKFTIDVCADLFNCKVDRFFLNPIGLLPGCRWNGRCWLNPPYGREITGWIKKAFDTAMRGNTVVALVPTRTNAPWWHDYVLKHDGEIRFIRKKLSFDKNGCKCKRVPFTGHAIIVFGNKRGSPRVASWDQPRIFSDSNST